MRREHGPRQGYQPWGEYRDTNTPLCIQVVPEHGVFGEEHGLKFGSGAGADYMWVLDPIDGTKSFITGGLGQHEHGYSFGVAMPWWHIAPSLYRWLINIKATRLRLPILSEPVQHCYVNLCLFDWAESGYLSALDPGGQLANLQSDMNPTTTPHIW